MVKLSLNNVVDQFRQLSGCDADEVNANLGIIRNSVSRVSVSLDDKKSSERGVKSAEYAAAACAFYDYICAEHAKNRIFCTLTGNASQDTNYKSRIESAKSLRDSALEAIKPIMLGCDFVFRTMEG